MTRFRGSTTVLSKVLVKVPPWYWVCLQDTTAGDVIICDTVSSLVL